MSGFAGRSPSAASGGRSSTTPSRRGAPFIVVDGRYGVAGAQDSDSLPQLLRRAWDETHPVALAPSGPDG